MVRARKADVAIDGQLGFYQLQAGTPAGRRFLRMVQGYADGAAYSDDTRMTREIAIGAVRAGLRVEVNGQEYTEREVEA